MIIRPSYLYTFLEISVGSLSRKQTLRAPLAIYRLWLRGGDFCFARIRQFSNSLSTIYTTSPFLYSLHLVYRDDGVVHQIYSLYLSGQRPVKKLFSSDVFCNTFCQSRHTKEATDTLHCTSRQYVQFLTGWFFGHLFLLHLFHIFFQPKLSNLLTTQFLTLNIWPTSKGGSSSKSICPFLLFLPY